MTKLAEYGYTTGVLEFFLGKNEDQILENVTSKGNTKKRNWYKFENHEHVWFGRRENLILLCYCLDTFYAVSSFRL